MSYQNGILLLNDGTVFKGVLSGAKKVITGEVGFVTSMTGYLETLTDPCSANMLLAFTYPLIGNYGVLPTHGLSSKIHANGVIVREACSSPSNFQYELSFNSYLIQQDITMLEQVDTRALVRHIRINGPQRGAILSAEGFNLEDAKQILYREDYKPSELPSTERFPGRKQKLVVLNLGSVDVLINDLRKFDFDVVVYPSTTSFEELIEEKPDAVIISEGPEIPVLQNEHRGLTNTIKLLAEKIPILAFGLGHLLLAEALGGRIAKLPVGHRGSNHPVKVEGQKVIEMTRQNHGYTVMRDSVGLKHFTINQYELHDQSIEGLHHLSLPIRTQQYYTALSLKQHLRELLNIKEEC